MQFISFVIITVTVVVSFSKYTNPAHLISIESGKDELFVKIYRRTIENSIFIRDFYGKFLYDIL